MFCSCLIFVLIAVFVLGAGLPVFSGISSIRSQLLASTSQASHPFSGRAARVFGMAKLATSMPPVSTRPSETINPTSTLLTQSHSGSVSSVASSASGVAQLQPQPQGLPLTSQGTSHYQHAGPPVVDTHAGHHVHPPSGHSSASGSVSAPVAYDVPFSPNVVQPNQLRCYLCNFTWIYEDPASLEEVKSERNQHLALVHNREDTLYQHTVITPILITQVSFVVLTSHFMD